MKQKLLGLSQYIEGSSKVRVIPCSHPCAARIGDSTLTETPKGDIVVVVKEKGFKLY